MPRYAPIGKKKQYARRSRKGQRQGTAMTRQAIRSQAVERKYFTTRSGNRVSPSALLALKGARQYANYKPENYLDDIAKVALDPIVSVKIPKSLQKVNKIALKLSPGGQAAEKAQELLGTDKELSVAPIDLVGLGAGSMAVKGAAKGARAVSRASKIRKTAKINKYEEAVNKLDQKQRTNNLLGRDQGTLWPSDVRRTYKQVRKVHKTAPLSSRAKWRYMEAQERRKMAKAGKEFDANIAKTGKGLEKARKNWSSAKGTSNEVDEAYASDFFKARDAAKNAKIAKKDYYELGAGRSARQKIKDQYYGRRLDWSARKSTKRTGLAKKIRLRRSKTTVRPARVNKTRMEIARQKDLKMQGYADEYYAMQAVKKEYRLLSERVDQEVKNLDPEAYFEEMNRLIPEVASGKKADEMIGMLEEEYSRYLGYDRRGR